MVAKYSYTKKDNTYLTPPSLIQRGLQILAQEKGQALATQFDCDVCCSNENIPAAYHFKYGINDGLHEDWKQYNWCNPPFDDCKRWVQKAYYEQQCGKTSILLIPVRTETAYWFDYILFNENVKIYWLRKGYRFLDPNTKQELGVFKNALALVLFRGVNHNG